MPKNLKITPRVLIARGEFFCYIMEIIWEFHAILKRNKKIWGAKRLGIIEKLSFVPHGLAYCTTMGTVLWFFIPKKTIRQI